MDIKNIKVLGDSEVIIRQCNKTIHCLSNILRNYGHEVWYLVQNFNNFELNSTPYSQNNDVDLLANVA